MSINGITRQIYIFKNRNEKFIVFSRQITSFINIKFGYSYFPMYRKSQVVVFGKSKVREVEIGESLIRARLATAELTART